MRRSKSVARTARRAEGIPDGVTFFTRLELPTPVYRGDTQIACPMCGSIFPLTVGVDTGDSSDAPSFMTCEAGHQWVEALFPRRLGAEIVEAMFRQDPTRFVLDGPPNVLEDIRNL